MDEIDRAQARAQQWTEDALAEQRRRADLGLPAVGVCHWCGEPVAGNALFCDAECRADWERARRLKRIGGLA